MLIQESFINRTRDASFGESGKYEPFTDDVGKLFRSLQREYGKCVSRVYLDTAEGAKACGWVFQKRMKYEDARGNNPERDYYLREVWVQLFEREDECTRKSFPLFIA